MTKYLLLILSLTLFACNSDKSGEDKTRFDSETAALTTISDSLLAAMPYSIQVAAFRNRENALKLKATFNELGINVFIIESLDADSELYRTYAGPYASEDEVVRMLPKIQSAGYPKAFVKIHDTELAEEDTTTDTTSVFIDEERRQITTVGGCSNPSWSPTGREIAFIWQTGGKKGIYVVGTSGGPLSRIIEAKSNFSLTGDFVWSPDGNAVAFIGREFNSFNELIENLFIIRKKQDKPQRLTAQNHFYYKIKNIQWSPDSRFIAFQADYGEGEDSTEDGKKVFYREVAGTGYQVDDIDRFGGNNTFVGWESDSSLMYLSVVDNYEWDQGGHDALRRFDVVSQESEIASPFINVKQLSPIAFVEQKYIVSAERDGTGLSRLISFDITSREKFILFELDLHGEWFPQVRISGQNKLFFTIYDKLWQCSVVRRETVYPLSKSIQRFTVSPSGRRICFADNDNLYVVKLQN